MVAALIAFLFVATGTLVMLEFAVVGAILGAFALSLLVLALLAQG